MLFNSYEFLLVFLPLTLAVFFAVGRFSHHLGALWLGAASLFFYGWWNPIYVLLLLASVAFNYGMGYAIGHTAAERRYPLLVVGVSVDLALLAYFKYANFFLDTLNSLHAGHWHLLDIVLPLGISFFTFTQIAFLVDVYRGLVREYRLVHYLLFVTYFPHLIAGPVLHHKQMMPQFAHGGIYRPNPGHLALGLSIFIIGLAKKVLLADNLSDFATAFFDEARLGLAPGQGMAWMGAIAYSLQLYFDFSGYSDMAIGLSMLFGVRLPINFNSPYRSANIVEFWRRWHMTLSAFLRDYLYIPLGGNKKGRLQRYRNLLATMLLGGLWHGANWTYVVWGGLHGIFLCINHLWQQLPPLARLTADYRLGRWAARCVTLLAVVVAWVFFRADSMHSALNILSGMGGQFGWFGQTTPIREQMAYWVAGGLAIALWAPNTQTLLPLDKQPGAAPLVRNRLHRLLVNPAWLGLLLALSLARLSEKSEFLYFQF